ncbi:ribokinase [Arthrobacter livingstonensis]|uniref:Ribokinase n=1 Tax=Arthrobacter livingstonensis TaxID=670078 RepID=A0A2V5M1I0_9MICC|nr:ribokinase [Arthrobacter livingstonensis]PYI69086.1 ribokinase [Arthrobacter livingstonensis]
MTPFAPKNGSVLVIGSITCDLTSFSDRLPDPGETVLGNAFTMVLGGKGANQALAAARAGSSVSLIGSVGDDSFSELVLGTLAEEQVNTDYVLRSHGPTGIAHIRVDASAENDIVMIPLANSLLSPGHITESLNSPELDASVALIQLEIPHKSALEGAKACKDRGVTVILDPAPAPEAPLDEEFWQHVDIVTPNETEARLITGIDVTDQESAAAAGRWFTARGVARAVVTLAGAGAVVVERVSAGTDNATRVSVHAPFPVTAVDTTAAGDAFAGTLGSALAEGLDWEPALRRAMAGGALAVTVAGASPSLPKRESVDAFLANH